MNTTNNIRDYILHLADNALIMGHRCSEWCGHGPILEQDIAISNIALDYIGQARNFYQYAAEIINKNSQENSVASTEDSLAYLRNEQEFKNNLLVELPNGDWANTIVKVFFYSTYQQLLYKQLLLSADMQIAAIAEKSLKEVTYHQKWSADWVLRLGDGTTESKQKIEKAITELVPFVGELFINSLYEVEAISLGIAADNTTLKNEWLTKVNAVFEEATLKHFPADAWLQQGGKLGNHTEYMGYILAEMQYLQRAYPNSEW